MTNWGTYIAFHVTKQRWEVTMERRLGRGRVGIDPVESKTLLNAAGNTAGFATMEAAREAADAAFRAGGPFSPVRTWRPA